MSILISETTPETFQVDVIESTVPVLVDFWAPWCAPCRVLLPQLERIAAEMPGQLKIVKLNADTYPDFAKSLKVSGLPTLLLYRSGVIVQTKIGASGGYGAILAMLQK